VAALSGCQPDPPEEFSALQPIFFSSINLFDDKARQALPSFEQRFDRMADAVLLRLDQGEITDPTAVAEAGRALFYAAFALIVGHHGIEDSYVDAAALLQPRRYAMAGDDRAELQARMERARLLLERAATLRPGDDLLATVQRSVRFNLDVLAGAPSQSTLDSMLAAAQGDRFSMFTDLILLRDPALYPLSAPYMQRLLTIVCSPQYYDCDRMGPPQPPDGTEPRWLTSKVAGPVMLADFLAERVAQLLADADADPAQAMPALKEAGSRLQIAAGAMVWAEVNSSAPDLSIYPAADTLDARQGRIDMLRAGLAARMAGTAPPMLPETSQYYASRTYRAAYQCAACHMPRPDLPASFNGVPK
jgi:hypothetical protein